MTIGHPRAGVSPANARQLSHGVVLSADGKDQIDAHEFVVGDVVLMTSEAIEGAERGDYIELSVGYTCELDWTPGVDPVTGERYDCIQRKIVPNHLALLGSRQARAGKNARLRLDGHEVVADETQKDPMEDEVKELKAKLAAAEAKIEELEAKLAEAKGRGDAAEAKIAEAETKLAAEKGRADAAEATLKPLLADKARRDAADVAARVGSVLGKDYVADGKSAHEIRLDALKAVKAEVPRDDEKFVQAYFEGRFAAGAKFDYNETPAARKQANDDSEDRNDIASWFLSVGKKETK